MAVRRVYVIELDRAAGRRRDPRLPWHYVGSSARSPEERFEQHLNGHKSARIVKQHPLRLRPDLYEDIEPIRRGGSKAAVVAEKARAEELAACGFVAHCDGVSYGKGEGDWVEWGAERLAPVAGHAVEAARELIEGAFSPLDDERCVKLLRGESGFWVPGFIDQSDPPPAYGMLGHVGCEALLPVVREARWSIEETKRGPTPQPPGLSPSPS